MVQCSARDLKVASVLPGSWQLLSEKGSSLSSTLAELYDLLMPSWEGNFSFQWPFELIFSRKAKDNLRLLYEN